jgi:hypothetical protein
MLRRFRVESLTLGVLLTACAGESSNASGGNGDATGGGSGVGDIAGDFWIEGTQSERYYLTVTSPTEALVGRPFQAPVGYTIEYHRGATLGSEMPSGTSDFVPSGEYVLRPTLARYGQTVFALELGAGNDRARVATQSVYCHGNGLWSVSEATLVRDTTPTEVRVPEVLAPPWSWLSVFGERVFAAPLAAGIEVGADGAPVPLEWYDVDMGLGVGVGAVLDDWRSAMGRTLEFSGSITSTNGVDSPVSATLPVIDFGMQTGRISFESAVPEGVATWGNTGHYLIGEHGNCPDGCIGIGPGGGMGVRLAKPGPILRVVSTANMNVVFVLPGGTPTYATLPSGDGVNLVVADIPITSGLSDIFVSIEGAPTANPDPCGSQPYGLVASIEAAP